ILVPGGLFFHVQDAAPDPRVFADPKTLEFNPGFFNHAESALPIDQMPSLVRAYKSAHDNLTRKLKDAAEKSALNFKTIEFSETRTLDNREVDYKSLPKPLHDCNLLTYDFGAFYGSQVMGSAGQKTLTYKGRITLMSEKECAEFIKHRKSNSDFEYFG
ncbi:MAG TPA: hypothetical protein VI874_05065, partial [Candidatus Norongarragalinales archaeon]|nr:hypothetical protein [Candidatus Norongarragalinales archaeon]